MNLKFPYSKFQQLLEYLSGKQRSMPYRKLSGLFYGASAFALRYPATESQHGSIEVVDYLKAKSHKSNPQKWASPPTLITLYPDKFVFHSPNPSTYNGSYACIGRLISYLTSEHWYLIKYRRNATNATHVLMPERIYRRRFSPTGQYETSYWEIPAMSLRLDNYDDKADVLRAAGDTTKTRNGFTYVAGVGPLSAEPVLKRHWIPEKRREYMHRLKELQKHGEIRTRMGAFDNLMNNLTAEQRYGHYRSWSDIIVRKSELLRHVEKGDLEDHETYKNVLEYGVITHGLWRLPQDNDAILRVFNYGLEKMKEPLRRNLGAVVYS